MSYTPHQLFAGQTQAGPGAHPDGMQLYDVAALQSIYGRSMSALGSTVYGSTGSAWDPNDRRTYVIWDAGGVTDKIDVSAQVENQFIDLRPGHYSSLGAISFQASSAATAIGSNWTVGLGPGNSLGVENIAIAFGSYIENATGGGGNDVIVGNMLTNELHGMGGNDMLFADGFGIELADGVLRKKLGRDATGLAAEVYSSSEDADYRQVGTGPVSGWTVGADAAAYVADRAHQTNILDGGAGDDLLAGSDGKDTLIGGSDNDLLIGGKGEDILRGDAGNDILFGDDDRDQLLGGSGDDKLYGGQGNDVLKGEDGNDELFGEDGNDWLEGGDGIDLVEGNAGNDRLTGGKGNDKDSGSIKGGLFGGFGDDLIVSELNDGDDDIDGGLNGIDLPLGDGTDTIVYKYSQGNSTIRVVEGAWFSGQTTADFGLSITGARDDTGATGDFGSDTLTSIEKAAVEAGSGADTLRLDGKSYYGYLNYIDLGGQGSGFDNLDQVDASAATTNITIDLRNVAAQVLKVNDGYFVDSTLKLRNAENVIGSKYDDLIYGTNAATGSYLQGNSGNDKIYGGINADRLFGGSGDDLIVGGGGADEINGGTGADILVIDALDQIARGETEDRLYWKAYNASFEASNLLRGGIRTVIVNDNQSQDEQILAMLNSTEKYKGTLGELYEVTGSGDTQGLKITMLSGEAVTLDRWEEGEYGIHLETTKRRAISYSPINFGLLGTPGLGFGLGPAATLVVNLVMFLSELAVDPAWGNFAGDRFTLTQLRTWASQPGQPPRSNNLNGTEEDDTINGRPGDDRISGNGGNDTIDGGLGNDSIKGGAGNDKLTGGLGDDRLEGGDGDDVLEGGAGNDTLIGGAGRDVYLIHSGSGADIIIADAQDVIRFSDLASTAVTIAGGGGFSANSSQNKPAGANQAVGLKGDIGGPLQGESFNSASPYGFIADGNLALRFGDDVVTLQGSSFGAIEFADGVVTTASTYRRAALAAATTDGDDIIIGFDTSDGLRGGAGNDYLNGLGGNDAYYFGIGDGQDRIEDSFGFDQIILGAGITEADVSVSYSEVSGGPRDGAGLVRLSLIATDDWIEFVSSDIEEVHFADGTVKRYVMPGTGGPTTGPRDLHLVAGPNEYADAELGPNSGTVQIELNDTGGTWGGIARIALDPALSLGDLRYQRLGDGLALTVAGTGNRIDITRQYGPALQDNWRTYDISLTSNGLTFSAQLLDRLATLDTNVTQRLVGTANSDTISGAGGNDAIVGGSGADTLSGLAGHDLLYGGGGNDTLSGGDGNDILFGEDGDDQLDGGAGNDLLYAGYGSDTLVGGAGDDELVGNGQSILKGGAGADRISSKLGDVIIYELGDGLDTITSVGAVGPTPAGAGRREIRLGAGIDPLTTTLAVEGWAVIIKVNGSTTGQIRLDRVLQRADLPEIRFADGTVWRETEIYQRLFSPDNGNNTATGIAVTAPEWDNRKIGYIYGGGGDDTLTTGSILADEYRFIFAPGSGTDTISRSSSAGGRLLLYGFDPSQMTLARSGTGYADFTLTFTGTDDALVITDQEIGNIGSFVGRNKISDFTFANTTLFASDIRKLWLSQSATDGNDTIIAFDGPGGVVDTGIVKGIQFAQNPGNDTLGGGRGDDLMIGGSGDDTYVINVGDGVDTVRDIGLFRPADSAGYDVLKFQALSTAAVFKRSTIDAKDLVITFTGTTDQVTIDEFYGLGRIEEFEFGDGVLLSAIDAEQLAVAGSATGGNDIVLGSAEPDTLSGGAGDDTLDGREGSDRYLFDLGDGHDIVSDTGTGESNTLAFGTGITAAQVAFQKLGSDLKATFGTGDSVTITGQYSGAANRPIAQAVFADGSRLSAAEIDQLVLAQQATAGNDTITGFASNDGLVGGDGNDVLRAGAGNDTLAGGAGDDLLDGQQGSDVYLIEPGGGHDVIASTGDAVASDVVRFGGGLTLRDVEFVRTAPTDPDLQVSIRGSTQSVTITGYFSGLAVKEFQFSDGAVLDSAGVNDALADAVPLVTNQGWRMSAIEGVRTRIVVPEGLFADDRSTDELVFTAALADGAPLPDWLRFDGHVFEAEAGDAHVGTYAVELTVADRFGSTAQRTIKLDILNANEAPRATNPLTVASAAIDEAFNFALPQTLFEDDDLAFANVPTAIAGTYSSEHGGSFALAGDGSFTYTPNGSYSGADRVYLPYSVGTAQALELPFDFSSTGSPSAGVVPPMPAPRHDTLTITATLPDGDPLPAWLTFDGTAFSGTPTNSDAGPLAIVLVATDAAGRQARVPFGLRVGAVNAAPTANALSALSATQDEPFSFTVPSGVFADADVRDRLAITATLANGNPLPSWLDFDGETLTGTPANQDVGSISLRFVATDIFGASATADTVLLTHDVNDQPFVGDPIIDQLATQGQAFTFAVPGLAFGDVDVADALSLSASLDTGEPLPGWLTFSNGIFSGTPADGDTGLLRLRVTATDAGGLAVSQDFWLGIADSNDAPVVAENLTAILTPAGSRTVFKVPSSLFADVDDDGYRVGVTLQDGSALPSWITFDPYAETISFNPAVSQLFRKTSASTDISLKITATDNRGASVSTTLSARIGAPATTTTLIGNGSSTISATSAFDLIDPGSGNQTITGPGRGDRIKFARGYGVDIVNLTFADGELGAVVEFGPDITLSDLSFSRADFVFGTGSNQDDLGIKINGSAEELRIYNQFGQTPGAEAVREFVFADGSVLSAPDLVAILAAATPGDDLLRGSHAGETLVGGAGNDTIYGLDGDDVIDGGPGDDKLYGDSNAFGYGGSDTFLFGRGSGNDVIFADTGSVSGASSTSYQLGIDTLRFGAGITASDLIVTHLPGYPSEVGNYVTQDDAGSLLIQISGTNDSVKIDHQFYLRHPNSSSIHTMGVERFEFADGTIMNRSQFEALITLAATTSGNDAIYGGAAADRLIGGAGDDVLIGEDGADTYVYNPGDGNDRIVETALNGRLEPLDQIKPRAGNIISFDTLSFGAGITADNIVFTKPDALGEDLIVSFNNQPGQIYIEGQFRTLFHGQSVLGPTVVTDYFGTPNAAIDEIRFADGTRWSLADIYAFSVRATPGDDVIDGFFVPNETLDGGAGNDLLVGRNGDDTYVFGRGYGHDRIKEFGWFYSDGNTSGAVYTANDKIKFVGLASSDVTTSIGAGGSFIFRINDTGETLTILPESEFTNFRSIVFTDTTWNASQFQSRWTIAAATAGNDQIFGFLGNDTLSGGDGDDTIQGGQNTGTPQTGLGYDTLNGGLGNDTLILESSDNDRANGDDGDDMFRFVMTVPYWTSQTLAGVNPERGRIDYPNFLPFGSERGIIDGGAGQDRLILSGKLADYWRGGSYLRDNGDGSYTIAEGVQFRNIEVVQFADGAVSTASLIAGNFRYRPGIIEGTSAGETMTGTTGADALYGYAGNDTLRGLDGNDFLIGGAGTDTYDGGNGIDIVDYGYDNVGWAINLATGLATQAAVTETFVSIEGAYGSSAADTITGSANADVLAGGRGDDVVNAGAGDDFIEFEGRSSQFYDAFDDGFDAVDGGSGWDTIRATYHNPMIGLSSLTGVEAITADGFAGVYIQGSSAANVLDFSSVILTGIERIDGGAGNDVITGSLGADVIRGSVGDDSLSGGDGDDIFYVSGTSDGFDAVHGGAGFDRILANSSNTRIGLTAVSGIELISGNGQGSVYISGSSSADTLDFSAVLLKEITRIDGGSGNDTITGSTGNDVIQGSGGDDNLSGGAGDDVFQYTGSSGGYDRVDGGSGTNSIIALANSTVIGLSSLSNIQSISGGSFTGVNIIGSGAADTLDFSAVRLSAITKIDGGAGNDVITGSSAADVILGSGGDDTLSGGSGDDIFQYTGTANGADAVEGGDGADMLVALAAGTTIGLRSLSNVEIISSGGFANVTIAGSGFADVFNFSAVTLSGISAINAGAGNDIVMGSAASDVILGGSEDDILYGLAGDDTLNGGTGSNLLDGGMGVDVAQYSGTAGSYSVSDNGDGSYALVGSGVNDTLIGIENLAFSDGTVTVTSRVGLGLTLTGTAAAETLTGGGNNDIITGLGGDDILIGNGGNDTFRITGSADGFDSFDGGAGTDVITATVNNAVIGVKAISGIETITSGGFSGVSILGSANGDILDLNQVTLSGITKIDGGAGNDVITGSASGETIAGSGGDDILSGGAGNDTFQYTGTANGFDAVDGGTGSDTIVALANSTVIGLTSVANVETISAGSFTGVSITGSGNGDTLDFSATTLTAIALIDGGAGNDLIVGSSGANTIRGSGGDDTINTGDGNDTIQFTGTASGFDAIDGGLGTDTIVALANSTIIGLRSLTGIEAISAGSFTGVTIAGSSSGDTLDFSAVTLTAITRIEGGAGNDVIIGNAAANVIWGGTQNDTIDGGAGNDTLLGDDGDDVIKGGAGTDIINGGTGVDTVDYSAYTVNVTVNLATTTAQTVSTGDSDTITNVENATGGSGADTITGTTTANVLNGGAGNDRLKGGGGNDTIIGGAGTTDVAIFAGLQASYSVVTNAGTVTIVDNQPSTDGNDGTDTINGIEKLEFKGGVQVGVSSPIILDLDGDGIETLSASQSRARFDLDGDGIGDDTSWIGSGDGFLFLDRDGNGTMSGAKEISFIDDVDGAPSDLAGLAAFDSNGDGVLDRSDARFSDFGVWRDADGDGLVDLGETATLAEVGIASLNLTGTAVNGVTALGEVAIIAKGTFTLTGGATGEFADAALTYYSAKTNLPLSSGGSNSRTSTTARDAYFLGAVDGEFLSDWFDMSTGSRRDALGFTKPWQDGRGRGIPAFALPQQAQPSLNRFTARSAIDLSRRLDAMRESLHMSLEPVEVAGEATVRRGPQDLPMTRSYISGPDALHDMGPSSESLASRLALMRQALAAFGAKETDGLLLERPGYGMIQDWFA